MEKRGNEYWRNRGMKREDLWKEERSDGDKRHESEWEGGIGDE